LIGTTTSFGGALGQTLDSSRLRVTMSSWLTGLTEVPEIKKTAQSPQEESQFVTRKGHTKRVIQLLESCPFGATKEQIIKFTGLTEEQFDDVYRRKSGIDIETVKVYRLTLRRKCDIVAKAEML
jgi:hypothetical protein